MLFRSGKLETRIQNLEYYTALNALEKSTTSFNVRDTDGNDRFKLGLLVDPFSGHNVGDPTNPDYKCSIDIVNRDMLPSFVQKSYNLDLTVGSTGFMQRGDLITAVFSEEAFISQPLASRSVNVNPYSVFDWIGKVVLSPNNDFWKDTRAIPTNINNSNGLLDNIAVGSNPSGSNFNQWNNNTFGILTTIDPPGQIDNILYPLSGFTVNTAAHRR